VSKVLRTKSDIMVALKQPSKPEPIRVSVGYFAPEPREETVYVQVTHCVPVEYQIIVTELPARATHCGRQ
jgi:hypothetical protein